MPGPPELTGDALRRLVIERSASAGVGHIASALCICDVMAVLFRDVLRGEGPDDPARDRFILSKGHASLALYAALHMKGILSADELATFCQDGSLLGVHPERALRGVELSTGSLGLGLSVGAGFALSARNRRQPWRTFVLVSDAECNEGQVWEAVMFAAHHRLSNLTLVIDDNGMQALGRTSGILDLQPLDTRLRAFGWDTVVVDGHDETALREAFSRPVAGPQAIVAKTVTGKGVSFMEGKLEWHYFPVSPEQARVALRELGGERP